MVNCVAVLDTIVSSLSSPSVNSFTASSQTESPGMRLGNGNETWERAEKGAANEENP